MVFKKWHGPSFISGAKLVSKTCYGPSFISGIKLVCKKCHGPSLISGILLTGGLGKVLEALWVLLGGSWELQVAPQLL